MAIRIPVEQQVQHRSTRSGAQTRRIHELLQKDLFSFGNGLNDVRRERIFRDLHMLVQAGVDPRSVLDLLVKAQRDKVSQVVLGNVRDGVMRGMLISDAMEAAGAFTAYEIHSVRIGEESGRLAPVCLQLAEHHADRIKLARTIRQAFAYPLFILAITLAVVFFMMNVVVPMFAQVFARSGAELPALTQAVLRVSDLIRTFWPLILLLLVGGAVLYASVGKRLFRRPSVEHVLYRLPIYGELRRKALMVRHCRAMAFLLQAGSPLDRALDLCTHMAGSARLEAALHQVRQHVVLGRSLKEAMAEQPLFDAQLIAMLAVAEEVKQLDVMYLRASERYTAEVQHSTTLLSSVLEPATILVIAVLVGTVLIAMYLPMFKLSTAFY
jgi:type IV pilus assembly protein PilC